MRKIIIGGMIKGTNQKTKHLEVADDATVSAAEALRQYLEVGSHEEAIGLIEDHVVRVDNRTVAPEDLLSTTVDRFMTIYPAQVAQGGVRGAGDRISIQFEHPSYGKSVALFSHWGGKDFLNQVREYLDDLNAELNEDARRGGMPLDRLEPRTVMVDFIRHITKNENRVTNDLYLGVDGDDGDNSDNGHFVIDLSTNPATFTRGATVWDKIIDRDA